MGRDSRLFFILKNTFTILGRCRSMPVVHGAELKFLGCVTSEKDWDKLLPVADFWKAYDARKK